MIKYDHKKIESKWQKYWEDKKSFAATDDLNKKKYYCLIEFPYPSGDGLHVGHPRSNTALDILSHKRRMEGYNVLYPIGFDSFGLPSENYAIKTGVHPAVTTKKNIETFSRQLKALGFSFDWDRQVETTDPNYYKWTQWIFLKMHEEGLAYKDKININWCPSCKTGLANEEVVSGNCERCGHEVTQRVKEQWMLKITKYADRLIEDLDKVDYLDRIKAQQINWIGKSEGAEVDFKVDSYDEIIKVYTTRPDTLFGATFMVLSPEHALVKKITTQKQEKEVNKYIEAASKKTDLERTDLQKNKTGVFTGAYAINPVSNEKVPIWIADYVLISYGTGAIMAVPAHDQRDWDFAKKYDLEIIEVIKGGDVNKAPYEDTDNGVLVNSGRFDDMNSQKVITEITRFLAEKGIAKFTTQYKLRDWVFSRQRYWGEPIPMINCEKCGWVRVPEKDLPIELPKVEKYQPTEHGESPLAVTEDWVNTTCPECRGKAKRETDTMPNWAGSNWYFLRYIDPHNNKEFAHRDKLAYWMPVDWYNGGMEHTTLHLLYSRFVYKFLYDIGAIPEECGNEPYKKRTSHGMILGEGGEKMSKSKGNVINPDDVIDQYGADTIRLYEMFMGPFDQQIPWDTKGVLGVRRFLEKVVETQNLSFVQASSIEMQALLHQTIKKVSNDIETQDYNTAVSSMMILVNKILEENKIDNFTAETLLKLLAPFAPHICEELWNKLGNKKSIFKEEWPVADELLAKAQEVQLVIQINGKVRDKITVPSEITEQRAEILARKQEKIARYIEDADIKNIIFIPGRLINFVIQQ